MVDCKRDNESSLHLSIRILTYKKAWTGWLSIDINKIILTKYFIFEDYSIKLITRKHLLKLLTICIIFSCQLLINDFYAWIIPYRQKSCLRRLLFFSIRNIDIHKDPSSSLHEGLILIAIWNKKSYMFKTYFFFSLKCVDKYSSNNVFSICIVIRKHK